MTFAFETCSYTKSNGAHARHVRLLTKTRSNPNPQTIRNTWFDLVWP